MIELLDIRYAQNYILDEDVMYKLQSQLSPGNLQLIFPLHILNKRARHVGFCKTRMYDNDAYNALNPNICTAC